MYSAIVARPFLLLPRGYRRGGFSLPHQQPPQRIAPFILVRAFPLVTVLSFAGIAKLPVKLHIPRSTRNRDGCQKRGQRLRCLRNLFKVGHAPSTPFLFVLTIPCALSARKPAESSTGQGPHCSKAVCSASGFRPVRAAVPSRWRIAGRPACPQSLSLWHHLPITFEWFFALHKCRMCSNPYPFHLLWA